MITFWQLRQMSDLMGEMDLTKMIAFLWIFSSLILYVINSVVPSTKAITIGFSGVLMGMILVFEYMISNKNLLNVSSNLLILLIPQLLIPNISFLGHVSGLLAGILWLLIKGIF
jgi:rhomboid domain-containing protein 1